MYIWRRNIKVQYSKTIVTFLPPLPPAGHISCFIFQAVLAQFFRLPFLPIRPNLLSSSLSFRLYLHTVEAPFRTTEFPTPRHLSIFALANWNNHYSNGGSRKADDRVGKTNNYLTMFNFNHDQGAGNNRCGGYSIAAIATMLQPNGNHDPQPVYNILRGRQVGLGPNSQNLVADTQHGGTDILLLSTFLTANYAQLNYELYLNRTTFVREAAPELPLYVDANIIVDEEIAKISPLQGAHLHLLTVQPDEIGPSLEEFLLDDYVNNQHRYSRTAWYAGCRH